MINIVAKTCNEEGLKQRKKFKVEKRRKPGVSVLSDSSLAAFTLCKPELPVWTSVQPTLPGPPPHRPGHSDPHPSWAGCTTEYRPHHRSSSPDQESSPCHPNQAECSSGSCLRYSPSPLKPLVRTGHHCVRVPALQQSVCAARLGRCEALWWVWKKEESRVDGWKAGVQCKVGPIWLGRDFTGYQEVTDGKLFQAYYFSWRVYFTVQKCGKIYRRYKLGFIMRPNRQIRAYPRVPRRHLPSGSKRQNNEWGERAENAPTSNQHSHAATQALCPQQYRNIWQWKTLIYCLIVKPGFVSNDSEAVCSSSDMSYFLTISWWFVTSCTALCPMSPRVKHPLLYVFKFDQWKEENRLSVLLIHFYSFLSVLRAFLLRISFFFCVSLDTFHSPIFLFCDSFWRICRCLLLFCTSLELFY